jgi:hypothetical protein
VPQDSVRCTRVDQLELATFGFLGKPLRYNSLDCPVCHVVVVLVRGLSDPLIKEKSSLGLGDRLREGKG